MNEHFRFKICAPRTVIHIFNPLTLSDVETIHGMCYSGSISPTMKVYLEDENLSEYSESIANVLAFQIIIFIFI